MSTVPSFAKPLCLAAAVLALAAAAPAQAQIPSGASVSGFASGTFQIGCTTCPHYVLTLVGTDTAPIIDAGGPGALTANASATFTPDRLLSGVPGEYSLGGSIGMAATAAVVGAMGTPLLGAWAEADNVQSFIQNPFAPGGLQMVGIDYYSAFVDASAAQLYSYSGSQSASYTFHFTATGTLTDERASLNARAGFYGDNLEIALASGTVFAQGLPVAPIAPPPVQVNESFSVTMLFNPGDAYTLVTTLSAGIFGMYASGITTADAMHTLRVSAIDGDLSLLHAALVPVPEPGTAWLFGVAGLGVALRRRLQRVG